VSQRFRLPDPIRWIPQYGLDQLQNPESGAPVGIHPEVKVLQKRFQKDGGAAAGRVTGGRGASGRVRGRASGSVGGGLTPPLGQDRVRSEAERQSLAPRRPRGPAEVRGADGARLRAIEGDVLSLQSTGIRRRGGAPCPLDCAERCRPRPDRPRLEPEQPPLRTSRRAGRGRQGPRCLSSDRCRSCRYPSDIRAPAQGSQPHAGAGRPEPGHSPPLPPDCTARYSPFSHEK
jgi:hypothetical protein